MSRVTVKRYRCSQCGHVQPIPTNHYGPCWSFNRYNTCPKCPPFRKYPEYSGQTIWYCLDLPVIQDERIDR